MTTSCTAALEMSGLLLDIEPGDVVIVPSFTYVTSALAFVRAGARVLFADIEPHDPWDRSRVGRGAPRAFRESGARGPLRRHRLRPQGPHRCARASPAGRPGRGQRPRTVRDLPGSAARVVRTFCRAQLPRDEELRLRRGWRLDPQSAGGRATGPRRYDKGTDREAFLLGQVDKYSWRDLGSSFGMSDLLAAYLLRPTRGPRADPRKAPASVRALCGAAWAQQASELGYRIPVVPTDRAQAFHMFYVLLPDRARRDRCWRPSPARASVPHSTTSLCTMLPPRSDLRLGRPRVLCSEDISGRLLRLPFYNSLADEEIDRISEIFLEAARIRLTALTVAALSPTCRAGDRESAPGRGSARRMRLGGGAEGGRQVRGVPPVAAFARSRGAGSDSWLQPEEREDPVDPRRIRRPAPRGPRRGARSRGNSASQLDR